MTETEKDSALKWWECAQAKGANYLRIVKSGRFYALEACKHGTKARIAQKSIGTTDEKVAQITRSRLLTILESNEPDIVVEQYIQHKLRIAENCQGKKDYERLYIAHIKTEKTNASRLKVHLLQFCKKFHIHNTRELYRRDTIGRYICYLQETVPIISTRRAIVTTTKAFLHWFDLEKQLSLINETFIKAFEDGCKIFGDKQDETKPFLSVDECKALLASQTIDYELRAMIVAHLVGGLRDMEVMGLRWRDLHEQQGYLEIRNAKGGIARFAQFPKVMQDAFNTIRQKRLHHTLGNDYVFSEVSYSIRNEKIKAFLRASIYIVGKDYASNCLRRSGCDWIDSEKPGFGDRQLGHSANSRTTEVHYHNRYNFRTVNQFWNDQWDEIQKHGLRMISLSDNLANLVCLRA